MVRTPCHDKNGLRKGTWTPEEDRKLMAYVTKYGCWNWRQLPKYAGLSRCGKSCRLRYLNYLRPNIKRGNFTQEEEETILRLHGSLGNRWSTIAAQLPGRTDNEIKNHWHTSLKKRMQNDFVSTKKPKQKLSGQHSSQHKIKNQKHQNTAPITNINHHPIINSQAMECSSPFSLNPCSPSDISLVSNDEFAFEPYEEPTGNFWTEPFVSDNYYDMHNEFMVPFLDPLYPLLEEDILCSYSLFEY